MNTDTLPRIKGYLAYRGVNQIDLAKRLGVNKGTVSRILKRGNKPHAETLANIATALGTTVGEMLKAPPL